MQQVFLLCCSRHVQELVEEVIRWLTYYHSPATIFLYGITPKQHNGFMVIAWEENVSPAFKEHITQDWEIVDFVIYDTPLRKQEAEKAAGE